MKYWKEPPEILACSSHYKLYALGAVVSMLAKWKSRGLVYCAQQMRGSKWMSFETSKIIRGLKLFITIHRLIGSRKTGATGGHLPLVRLYASFRLQ